MTLNPKDLKEPQATPDLPDTLELLNTSEKPEKPEKKKVCQSGPNHEVGCHKLKPLSAFPRNPRTRDGHFNLCRDCLVAKQKEGWDDRRAALAIHAMPDQPSARSRQVTMHVGYGVRYSGEPTETTPKTAAAPASLPASLPTVVPTVVPAASQELQELQELPSVELTGPAKALAILQDFAMVTLEDWLTRPPLPDRGEGLMVLLDPTVTETSEGALLLWRQGGSLYLLSASPETYGVPENDQPVPEHAVRAILAAKLRLAKNDTWTVVGVAFS